MDIEQQFEIVPVRGKPSAEAIVHGPLSAIMDHLPGCSSPSRR
jgi:hypothetical protein